MNITIDERLKTRYPHVQLGLLIYDVTVEERNSGLWDLINGEVIPKLMAQMERENVTEIENIAYSRQAYKAFGKDPGRYRVSSEALYRRIKGGKGLYKINTVVDVNNLISLETGFSVGSYDLDRLQGDVCLTLGKEGESYQGIGKDSVNIENLPVLKDKEGPFGSPTSDSTKAMITPETKRVVTLIYDFSPQTPMTEILARGGKQLEQYTKANNITQHIV